MSPRPNPIIIPGPSGMGSNMQSHSSQVNLTAFLKLLDATLGERVREKKRVSAGEAAARLLDPGRAAVEQRTAIGPEGFGVNLPDTPAQESKFLPLAQTKEGRKTILDMIKTKGKEGLSDEPFSTPRMYQDKEGKHGKKGAYRWGFFSKDAVPKMIKDTREATKKELEHAAAVSINLGKPASAGEREKLAEGAASIDALNNIKTLFGKEFVGPLEGRRGSIQNIFGLNPEKRTEFIAATAIMRNSIIKQVTGSQMSEPEAKRIIKQIPDEFDAPKVWNAKWKQSMLNVKMLQKRRQQVLKESGLKVPTMGRGVGEAVAGEKKPIGSFGR